MTTPRYAVITNSNSFLFKHEVWYSGKTATISSHNGEVVEADKVMIVAAFALRKNADAYIDYHEAVRKFKE